jgi:Flp pilus assembly pilin Flp
MKNLIKNFAKDERGSAAIEYGMIAAGCALVIVPAVHAMGDRLDALYAAVKLTLITG